MQRKALEARQFKIKPQVTNLTRVGFIITGKAGNEKVFQGACGISMSRRSNQVSANPNLRFTAVMIVVGAEDSISS